MGGMVYPRKLLRALFRWIGSISSLLRKETPAMKAIVREIFAEFATTLLLVFLD